MMPYALAAAAFILFGSTALVVKPSAFTGVELVFLRMAITASIIVPPIFWRGQRGLARPSKRALLAACATSAAIFLNMVCLFSAFKLAPIPVCVALFYTGPMLTLVFRAWLDGRRLSGLDGGALAAAVVVIAVLLQGSGGFAAAGLKGYALALCGGFFFSLIPLVERGAATLSPVTSLGVQSTFATLCLAPFVSFAHVFEHTSELPSMVILAVLFTLAPFLLWWRALRLDAKISPFIAYVDPMTSVLVATLLLDERVSALEGVSSLALGVIALTHIALARRLERVAALPAGVTP